jgi:hypothetical protein
MNAIYIDADACPVKDETYRVAERHGLKVYVVSNGGIRPNPSPLIETVIVAQGADAADMWIADRVGPGDICITGDIPLAAKVLEAGAAAIRHNGDLFTTQNIGQQLGMRDLMADIRSANPLGASGGGRPFGKADRSRFLNSLEQVVRKVKKA